MNIGLDIMGGDNAPDSTIDGAILACKDLSGDDRIFLFGDKDVISEKLQKRNKDCSYFEIVHAPDAIGMSDQPIKAFTQKTQSSISIGFHYLKEGKIDAFASAGNSGAMVVGSMYSVEMIQGIFRPCTAVVLPKENGGSTFLLDIGTNPDPKPEVMYQFGILGSFYAKYVYNIENPRVGLLNIGAEAEKGNILTQATYKLMKDSKHFNFVGNVEGRDILLDTADVIVSDGFTGNVLLKQLESMYHLLRKRNLYDEFVERMNYENFGGTPVLGIKSTVVVGHGISNDNAIKNMILLTKNVHKAELSLKIQDELQKHS
ncbi:MAG: phosphate acyltransferase PlsX [Bacteroidales bacterium]|nr:phosphate acyltransferase PlsX [Bacteroidales bacterium]